MTTHMGGCQCGAVRYTLATDKITAYACHCLECQKQSASAFAISVPISWYLIQEWLQDFAYKTNMSWWVFMSSGLGMVLVAIMVISTRTYKTAKINPVESLRNE